MDRLVKLPAVAEGKDVGSLRSFVGQGEVIIRGLQSLSLNQNTFGSLLIPILLGKLPEDIKLQVTRFISSEIWKCAFSVQRAAGGNKPVLDRADSDGTAGSFVAKLQVKGCVFCNGNQTSHKCSMIQTPKERKRYLIENARCFKCLQVTCRKRVRSRVVSGAARSTTKRFASRQYRQQEQAATCSTVIGMQRGLESSISGSSRTITKETAR